MATTVTIQVPQAFTRGTTIYPPRAIPAATERVRLVFDRTAFTGDPVGKTGDARVAVVLAMVLSLDGGVSWRAFGSCGAEGGATGATESGYEITVPEPGNPNRQIAAVLAVTGAITLGITATVFP